MSTTKTGRLKATNRASPNDYEYYVCGDCDTMYPVLVEHDEEWNEIRAIKCNGHAITVCPWCRPDSEPWKNGRGK